MVLPAVWEVVEGKNSGLVMAARLGPAALVVDFGHDACVHAAC
jgi:hypothetical protein